MKAAVVGMIGAWWVIKYMYRVRVSVAAGSPRLLVTMKVASAERKGKVCAGRKCIGGEG